MEYRSYPPPLHVDKPQEKVESEPEWSIIQSATFTSLMNEGADSKKKRTEKLPAKPFLPMWNKLFLLACVVAVSLDPLFFYIPIIDQNTKCVRKDKKLAIFAVFLRSITDITYVLDIIYNVAKASVTLKSEQPGLPWKSRDQFINYTKQISKRLSWLYILVDLLAILPIPQVVILGMFSKVGSPKALNIRKLLNIVLLSQYAPRVFRIYLSSSELTRNSYVLTGTPVWVKGTFNFFLYILASHVFGAFWYYFSFQRLTSCWYRTCSKSFGCELIIHGCFGDALEENNKVLDNSCPVNSEKPEVFDFGIFLGALKSGLLETYDFPKKLLHCFWWGLRNLSSLGENLQTSTYIWENSLAVSISIIGLLLFLYLIGNLQAYMALARTRSDEIQTKMKMKERDVEWWLKKNDLPMDRKAEIMQKVRHKLEENKDVDVENLLSILSPEDRKSIKLQLCLPLLRQIPIFERMSELVLGAICDHLKPVIYNESNFVIREGEPLDRLIFITQGTAWSYSAESFNGETVSSGRVTRRLKKGNCFGEQLINWATKSKTILDFPISTSNLKSHTKVEAFVLMANDLMNVVSRFWRHFRMNLQETSWETEAVFVIETAWHLYKQRKKARISRSTFQNDGSSQRYKYRRLHVLGRSPPN